VLEQQAELLEYPMKMMECNLKFKYNVSQKHRFDPFRSKDIQEIIDKIVSKVVNVDELIRKRILLGTFLVHDMNAISDVEDKYR